MKSNTTFHTEAWERFGKDKCDHCGMSLSEHIKKYNRRLDMHCTTNPKQYHIMLPENWDCLCKKCHFLEEQYSYSTNDQYINEYQEVPDDCEVEHKF